MFLSYYRKIFFKIRILYNSTVFLYVIYNRLSSALTADLDGQSVYFVHSYYTDVPQEYLDVTADYGLPIPAMIHRGSVFGCQFHPEKSGAVGLGILEKFKEYVYENTACY